MANLLEDLGLELGYNSSEFDLVTDFYVPCLDVSERYDRAVGYFRSTIYALVGVAFSDFALRGGRIRLICSPSLQPEDAEAIRENDDSEEVLAVALEREITEVLKRPENMPVVQLLSTLLAHNALEVRIAYRPGRAGIFHEKLGIFHSSADSLSFAGSANETYAAWDPAVNHEGFETFGSWDLADVRRVERHTGYFDSLWDDKIDGLCVRPLPDVPRETLARFEKLSGVDAAVEEARTRLERVVKTRSGPRRTLQDHQKAVVANWSKKSQGIINHVTGAGKTLSALTIMRNWFEQDSRACALVLVPGDLLTQQWYTELRSELGDLQPKILVVGGKLSNPKWRDRLGYFASAAELGPRVIVATMRSASNPDFVSRAQGGEHILLVADEVHALGSKKLRRALEIDAGGRLGMSATPERFGDPEGTQILFDYFGPILKPEFGIPDAIAAGRLVPYDYHVSTVQLDDDELQEYEGFSKQIASLYAQTKKAPSESSEKKLAWLRIQRARVVKKARAKVPATCELVLNEYENGDRWLLYCEDGEQLEQVTECLVKGGLDVLEYRSEMAGDATATLRSYLRYGGVLVSIRCLDQGVDIPTIDHALILASSTNPRQFIQRRGRVLRSARDKHSADIYDLLVCKVVEGGEEVLNRDLERARTFARFARNEACRYKLDVLAAALEDVDTQYEDEEETGEPR